MNILKKLFYKPYQHTLSVQSPNGLHLRPVAKFVSFAKTLKCDVFIKSGENIQNAKNINSILQLSLKYNDEFELITQGFEAKDSLDKLVKHFEAILQEDAKDISTPTKTTQQPEPNIYSSKGLDITSIYQGVVISNVYNLQIDFSQYMTTITLKDAISKSIEELSKEDNSIFEAQKELLLSIDKSVNTIEKLQEYINKQILNLPPSMKAKAIDYEDILNHILSHMGINRQLLLPSQDTILVCDDLLPSQIKEIAQNKHIKGVILKYSSLASHSAILLRNYGITSAICDYEFEDNTTLILDTIHDTIILNPSKEDISKANQYIKEQVQKEKASQEHKNQKAITSKGKTIHVLANISDLPSAIEAQKNGADGIGLLRSEFMFTKKQPSLQEQIDTYTQIFKLFDNITVRTLDVGGDKELPYIDIPQEQNPFLGIRGIRLLKIVPDIIATQLLAIYKASDGKPIKIMFPMVSTLQEFNNAKEFALNIAQKHHIDISHIKFGMMIETPLVIFNLDKFNKVVDFYSIGSNDLAQYSFAIQRDHHTLKYDESSQEFLNLISYILKNSTKPISMCGELASNTKVLSSLLDMGLESLSISPAMIPTIKEEIRDV